MFTDPRRVEANSAPITVLNRPICLLRNSSVSDSESNRLAGLKAFIRSNLCTRQILLTLDDSGHHDWPDKRRIRKLGRASPHGSQRNDCEGSPVAGADKCNSTCARWHNLFLADVNIDDNAVLRLRICGHTACRALSTICVSSDRGQQYCKSGMPFGSAASAAT